MFALTELVDLTILAAFAKLSLLAPLTLPPVGDPGDIDLPADPQVVDKRAPLLPGGLESRPPLPVAPWVVERPAGVLASVTLGVSTSVSLTETAPARVHVLARSPLYVPLRLEL